MPLPDDILYRPADEATRRIALDLLDQARAAAARLHAKTDGEALHDFRVAVRRLRSTARAHRRHLVGALSRKREKQLEKLQRATGHARDLEVQHAWLAEACAQLPSDERDGLGAHLDSLSAARERRLGEARKAVRTRFPALDGKLTRKLGFTVVPFMEAPPPVFGAVVGGLARAGVAELAKHLEALDAKEEHTAIHGARIVGKRLRYLLEPVRRALPDAKDVVLRLKRLQDLLGDLHDRHVIGAALDEALHRARKPGQRFGDQSSQLTGLTQLARQAEDEAGALYATLRTEMLGEGVAQLVAAVDRVAQQAEGSTATETERKFLLRAFPPAAEGAMAKEIEQGYLPGQRLRERLRRVRRDGAVKHLRTIKVGSGLTRVELEEETTADLFEKLWPLTEGCRVHKRRYAVEDGGLTWVVDRFLDRELILAEVELPSERVRPALPAWLAAHLEREVTGEAEYVNLNLAR